MFFKGKTFANLPKRAKTKACAMHMLASGEAAMQMDALMYETRGRLDVESELAMAMIRHHFVVNIFDMSPDEFRKILSQRTVEWLWYLEAITDLDSAGLSEGLSSVEIAVDEIEYKNYFNSLSKPARDAIDEACAVHIENTLETMKEISTQAQVDKSIVKAQNVALALRESTVKELIIEIKNEGSSKMVDFFYELSFIVLQKRVKRHDEYKL